MTMNVNIFVGLSNFIILFIPLLVVIIGLITLTTYRATNARVSIGLNRPSFILSALRSKLPNIINC